MNYLDSSQTGGHPLFLDDISFIQNAYKEAFKVLSNILSTEESEPTYLIKGGEKTISSPGVFKISNGYIVINGEPYRIPEHFVSYLDENEPLFWTIEQNTVSPSPVEYRDFVSKQVHFERVAKVTTTVTRLPFETVKTVGKLLDIKQRYSTGYIAAENGWDGGLTYIKAHGRVTFYGLLSTSSNATHLNIMLQLPAELLPYFPGLGYIGLGPAIDSAAALAFSLTFATSGYLPCPVTRVFLNSPTITSSQVWPVTIVPKNLTLAPPRAADLRVLNPVPIPSGSDTVVYNFNGLSWDIAPE